jgi:imidazolonepropionase-like amidohydrolase
MAAAGTLARGLFAVALAATLAATLAAAPAAPQEKAPQDAAPRAFAVRGGIVHTMAGEPLRDGVVVVRDGRIESVGPWRTAGLPADLPVRTAAVVTPGLIDAHATVGLTGLYNIPHDQEQLEKSAPMQPELRAIDAYNPQDELVAWLRGFGITTVHTGHAPGALIAGQTMVVKTRGRPVEQDLLVELAMVAVTLGDGARQRDNKAPGTRSKAVAMLRERLQQAREYAAKRQREPETAIDLGHEVLGKVLAQQTPLLVTAHRAHDIIGALRVAEEFGVRIVLDGAAEAYTLLPELLRAGVWVLPHPAMARNGGDLANGTMELPRLLTDVGLSVAFQSGFESYVPKTRVVLFEAGVAVGKGLAPDVALRALTIDAARLVGVDARIGSLAPGKDADLALFDGDPFEYTTHCVGVVIDGVVVADQPR